jgi:hypothetical protein
MRVRYIAIDGVETIETVSKCPSYEKLAQFVNGPVESFEMRVDSGQGKSRKARMYVNENGGFTDEINMAATRLVIRAAELMGTSCVQFIHGNVVITQPNDD